MATPTVLDPSDIESSSRVPITPEKNIYSYELIKGKLMAAVEKRAAALSKFVMNDIERRLLQRQQANPFETFLVAVVLLACVERMCWYFKSWELDPFRNLDVKPDPTTMDPETTQALTESRADPQPRPPLNSKWPLDKPPAYFSQQGERFSDILHMLLKMRGVPPKLAPRPDNSVLTVWGEYPDDTTKEWCDAVALTPELLEERASARFEGVELREWELKFISKIIKAGIQS
jgi:hypothetical protein